MKILPKAVVSVVAALVVSTGVAVVPANAACQGLGTKGYSGSSSWTRAMSNDCAGNVQARVMRYIASSPTSSYGPKSRNSYVSASGGTAAGNALRIQISAGSKDWNGWQYF